MNGNSRRHDPTTALEQIEGAYRNSTAWPTNIAAPIPAERAEYFAAATRFAFEHPQAMHRLHCATAGLPETTSPHILLPRVLAGALTLTNADYGNLQLVDPETGALRLVSQFGFDDEFMAHFAVVDDNSSACGRAAKGGQTVIPDVAEDPLFTAHRDIARAADFRAVQSTPLVDYAGQTIGVVSTHFRHSHAPSDSVLRIMRLYADFAGETIASALCRREHNIDPIGRAVVTALLDPSRIGPADLPVDRPPDVIHRPAALLSPITSTFAGDLINRLSTVALHLAGTHNLVRHPVARNRLEMTVDQIDQIIREIHSHALSFVPNSRQSIL